MVVPCNINRQRRYSEFIIALSYTYVLKAANGQVIGRSESYSTKANRDAGINAVTNTAPSAPIEE